MKKIWNIWKILIYPNRIPRYVKEYISIIKTNIKIINNVETKPKHMHYGQLKKYRSVDMKACLEKQIELFKKNCAKDETFFLVEIGSYLGESLKLWGDICEKNLKNYIIIFIYSNKKFEQVGKEDIGLHKSMSNNINKVYQIFINNLSSYTFKENVVHIRKTSEEAFKLLKNLNLKIDFCYIDASHLYQNIKNDFTNYHTLIKKKNNYTGLLSGDDYEKTFDEIINFSSKTEDELLKYLNKLKDVDYIKLKNEKNEEIVFHPGITLFFKETSANIKKFKSQFWVKEN